MTVGGMIGGDRKRKWQRGKKRKVGREIIEENRTKKE